MNAPVAAALLMVGLALHCTFEGRFGDAAALMGIAAFFAVLAAIEHITWRNR